MNELPTPPEVATGNAVELLRAWVIGGELACSLDADIFADPATWGEVLAAVAQQVARARLISEGAATTETVAAIRKAFDQEFAGPAGGGVGGES